MLKISRLSLATYREWESDIKTIISDSLIINFPEEYINTNIIEDRCNSVIYYLKNKSAVIFIATEEEEFYGWVWCHLINRLSETRLHIAEIATKEPYRGSGVGKRLIECVEEYAVQNKIKCIDLLVTASNERALQFYKRQEFGVERLILKKELR